jgi:hypothetical protein
MQMANKSPNALIGISLNLGGCSCKIKTAFEKMIRDTQPHGIFDDPIFAKQQNFGVVE